MDKSCWFSWFLRCQKIWVWTSQVRRNFLDVVWPYDKLWKCSPDKFLSDAPTLVVIRQLLKDPTYFVKKVHFTPQIKRPPLRTQIWSTCQNIKKFKVVSRFLLWKKVFEESLHCRKVFVKNDFQGKKFVYSNERKLVWLFVKKIEYGTIIIFVLQKRLQEQKRQQKARSVYSLHFC